MMKNLYLYICWTILATFWTAIFFILPDFIDNPIDGLNSLFVVASFIGACSLGALFLLYVIGVNKYVTALALPLWGGLGSILAFYRVGYRVSLTPMLIDVTLHTNMEEASGVFSWQLIVWVLFNMLIACLFVLWRWKMISLPYGWIHGVTALFLCLIYASCNHKLQEVVLNQRFPFNIPHHTYSYISSIHESSKERKVPAFTNVNIDDSITIVLVLGEATRADHLQLNGYTRETTPRLSARANLVSYPYIFSAQTFTEACIPFLLTRADSTHPEFQYTETSFIRIFKEVGFQTTWISNQDLESVSYRPLILECDSVFFANAGKSVYVYSKWLDEDLLPIFHKQRTTRAAQSMYILHTIGSHWYYNSHVPSKKSQFLPTTTSRVVTNNSIEQLVNSYDNTVLYMDYFVDSLIATIEEETSILIFQSDHGEALGDDGLFLHGHEIDAVQYPACIIWYSDKYAKLFPEKVQALHRNKDKRYRTDYLFYSILSAVGIQADGENDNENIFK